MSKRCEIYELVFPTPKCYLYVTINGSRSHSKFKDHVHTLRIHSVLKLFLLQISVASKMFEIHQFIFPTLKCYFHVTINGSMSHSHFKDHAHASRLLTCCFGKIFVMNRRRVHDALVPSPA